MSSHARSSRAEERRLSIRPLIFASVGSAVAAILTSQFWIAGTPIAAALTPVIVALVSELLHRPTERIAQRLTTDVPALRESDTLPEAAGAGPPPRAEERDPRPAREAPMADPRRDPARRPPPGARPPRTGAAPEYRVHRTSAPASRLPWKVILVTAAAAFAIAAAVLTLPELIAGQSLSGDDRDTTFFGGGRSDDREAPAEQETEPQQTEETEQETEPETEQPDRTVPAPPTTPEQTTPTTPQGTTTQPPQPRASPPPAPPPPQR